MTEDLSMPAAGGVLRRLREQSELSLDVICRKLGWDRSRLSRYETGERTAYLSDVVLIAEAMGRDANEVVIECLRERYPSLRKPESTDAILLEMLVKNLKKERAKAR